MMTFLRWGECHFCCTRAHLTRVVTADDTCDLCIGCRDWYRASLILRQVYS